MVSRTNRLIESKESKLSYYLDLEPSDGGSVKPRLLGQGKFAFVYSGLQASTERGRRRVAIKILRPTASISDENLFDVELKMMRQMLEKHAKLGDRFINAAEILKIDPLIICGCGHIYTAVCPTCPDTPLSARPQQEDDYYHFLSCIKCKFSLSAEKAANNQGGEILYSRTTKPCCKNGVNCDRGSIINFKHRHALVLDVIDRTLHDFLLDREHWMQKIISVSTQDTAGSNTTQPSESGGWKSYQPWLQSLFSRKLRASELHALLERASIVERLKLMIELTAAVEQLHLSGIVHRDLAPDNVMIRIGDESLERWDSPHSATGVSSQYSSPAQLIELASEMVLHPRLTVKIIDFGLAEMRSLEDPDLQDGQRRWYDEHRREYYQPKVPFWSREAEQYRKKITLPALESLVATQGQPTPAYDGWFPCDDDVFPTDIIAVKSRGGGHHRNDLVIIQVGDEEKSGRRFAFFRGHPPTNLDLVEFEHVPRLGEAHDLFALGAILFYLFVRKDGLDPYRYISEFRDHIRSCQSDSKAEHRNIGSTSKIRDLLAVNFWGNEIATIAVQATIRGHSESFAKHRAVIGPAPVQAMLKSLKELYFEAHRQVVSELAHIGRLRIFTWGA